MSRASGMVLLTVLMVGAACAQPNKDVRVSDTRVHDPNTTSSTATPKSPKTPTTTTQPSGRPGVVAADAPEYKDPGGRFRLRYDRAWTNTQKADGFVSWNVTAGGETERPYLQVMLGNSSIGPLTLETWMSQAVERSMVTVLSESIVTLPNGQRVGRIRFDQTGTTYSQLLYTTVDTAGTYSVSVVLYAQSNLIDAVGAKVEPYMRTIAVP